MEENLYFAYGSNLDLEQMAQRCPDAEIVGPVRLENYELRFRGSGFATYYYRVIQRGFEANGLPVESLQAAWNRTIDEVWSGRIDKPKRAPERNRGPER